MIEFKSKQIGFLGNESFHAFRSGYANPNCKHWTLHGHEFFELELFTEGSGNQVLNGRSYEISEGSIHLLTTSDFHEMNWDENIRQLSVRFDQSEIDKKLIEKIFSIGHEIVCHLEGQEYETVKNMMSVIIDYYKENDVLYKEMFTKNMLESVIILLLGKFIACEKDKVSGRNHVQQAIAYLEMNFKNDPGLEEVATYVGLNKNYFSTLFSKVTGKSFVKYVIDLKLEYSKNLICASNMTMHEVCFNSGFKSFSNFAREFKKKFNKTPLQYRKSK